MEITRAGGDTTHTTGMHRKISKERHTFPFGRDHQPRTYMSHTILENFNRKQVNNY